MIFSIVTPSYNSLQMLRRCIGSVRNQVASAESDVNGFAVEHIVQDGDSSDGTAAWLAHYRERVRTAEKLWGYHFDFEIARDRGMYDAINKGWERCSGDVFSWLNCDEQYLPCALGKVCEFFDTHPDVDAVFGNMIIVDPNGRPLACRREIPLRRSYVAHGTLYAPSCATFYRRRLWERGLLRLNPELRYAADMDLALSLLEAGVRYARIDEYLALFTYEPGRNLSCSPMMIHETKLVRRRHGAGGNALKQIFWRICRRLEKAARGCYYPAFVSYAYANDEVPNLQWVHGRRLGFRLRFEASVSPQRRRISEPRANGGGLS